MGKKVKYNDEDLPNPMKLYLLSKKTKSKATYENYRGGLHRFNRYIIDMDTTLEDFTESDMMAIVGILNDEGKSKEAISGFMAIIHPFFKWYMNRRGVDKDEVARIVEYCNSQHTKQTGENAHPALTPKQQKELFENLRNPYLRNMVWASISYGFRAQEICNLKVDDVILNEDGTDDMGNADWGKIVIRKSKGDKTREVYALRAHIPIWKMILKFREMEGVEFPNVFFWNGAPLSEKTYSGFFSRHIAPAAPCKMTSHSLRRTFATNLYRRGVDLVVIQNLLGHESVDMTRKYLNVLELETQQRYLSFMHDSESTGICLAKE